MVASSAYLRPLDRDSFEIAIICALRIEADAIEALIDEDWEADPYESYGKAPGDPNAYTIGRIGQRNIVLAFLPGIGKVESASVAASFRSSFTNIRLGLVVGICGSVPFWGTPPDEIVLGDVLISTGVIEYDFGRQYPDKFEMKDTLGQANSEVRAFLQKLGGIRSRRMLLSHTVQNLATLCEKQGSQSMEYPGKEDDVLYPPCYMHKHRVPGICSTCDSLSNGSCDAAKKLSCNELECDAGEQIERKRLNQSSKDNVSRPQCDSSHPRIFFGPIASGDTTMKSGQHRDRAAEELGVIGFEMEGAGVWDNLPTIVIKGVCAYADSHNSTEWRPYAAATAASCVKAFLREWRVSDNTRQVQNKNVIEIPISPVSEEQATLLLAKKLQHSYEPSELAELVRALDYMPLAITQAAAYINERTPRSSVRQYIDTFRRSEQGQA